jgi:hypothetical protein
MGFGIDTGISRNRNHSVNVAEKLNNHGDLLDMHSFGGKEEKTEEFYSSSFTNTATNGQSGTSIISGHNLIESNTEYAREQKTTVIALSTAA